MPVFGRRPGCPDPLPFDTVHRSPDVCSPRPAAGEPASVSESNTRSARLPGPVASDGAAGSPDGCAAPTLASGEPDPVAGVGTRSAGKPAPLPLDAVHADPVARVLRLTPPDLTLRSSWGAPSGLGPVSLCPWPSGCPTTRYPERVASRSVRARSHLVDRVRCRSSATRRCPLNDSVSRPRSACAARYESYLRERETPGQEGISNPQGYPPNFSGIPRNFASLVHVPYTSSCTGLSPTGVGRPAFDDRSRAG